MPCSARVRIPRRQSRMHAWVGRRRSPRRRHHRPDDTPRPIDFLCARGFRVAAQTCENPGMSNIYEYVRHPRVEERKLAGPVKTRDLRRLDHPNPFVRFNARFGLRITLVVGTMWMAYIFTIIALFALPDAIKQGTYFIIVWLSSSFLQLVLLPIIIVGQNIQARAADKRSEDTD